MTPFKTIDLNKHVLPNSFWKLFASVKKCLKDRLSEKLNNKGGANSSIFIKYAIALLMFVSMCAFGQEVSTQTGSPMGLGTADYLQVDCALFPQIVMRRNGTYEGFLIDIWEAVAEERGWQWKYNAAPDKSETGDYYNAAFTSMEEGKADVLLAACTKTAEREQRIDFSDQYYRSGLRIVTNKQIAPWYLFLMGFLSPSIVKAFFVLIAVLLLGGFFMWVFEKKHEDSEVKSFELGVQLAFETGSTIGHGFLHPKSRGARWTGYVVFICGAICFGNLLSEMTAEKTLNRLEGSIAGPSDLVEKSVATVSGTTTVSTLRDLNANVVPCSKLEDAFLKLLLGEVQAVVYDWPGLAYHLSGTAGKQLEAVGPLFEIQYYGVVFPKGSHLREEFNLGLHSLRESGRYHELYNKWFPGKES